MSNTTTAVGYIMMVGKDTSLTDLKGLDEGVFYQLYKGNVWKDLNGLTMHAVYQVVTQNLMQSLKQETKGTANVGYPNVLLEESYTDNGLKVNGSEKISTNPKDYDIPLTLTENMEDEGNSRYIELVKDMVKKVMEESYNLFGKYSVLLDVTSEDKGVIDGVVTILNGVFKDSSELERLGVLTEEDVDYLTEEIEEFIKYLENVNKWWLSKYAYMVRTGLGIAGDY